MNSCRFYKCENSHNNNNNYYNNNNKEKNSCLRKGKNTRCKHEHHEFQIGKILKLQITSCACISGGRQTTSEMGYDDDGNDDDDADVLRIGK